MPRTHARVAGVPSLSTGTADHRTNPNLGLDLAVGPEPTLDLGVVRRPDIDLTADELPPALAAIGTELTDAARSWVAQGATAVQVQVQGDDHPCVIAGQPPATTLGRSTTVALGTTASLHVVGPVPDAGQVQLVASLLGRVLDQASALDRVTDDLITAEDHLVAVREMAAPTVDSLDTAALAERLADDAVRLTGAAAAAVATADGVWAVAGGHAARTSLARAIGGVQGSGTALHLRCHELHDGILIAPLGDDGRALALQARSGHTFSGHDRELLDTIADHAAALLRLADAHDDAIERSTEATEAPAAAALMAQALPRRRPPCPTGARSQSSRPRSSCCAGSMRSWRPARPCSCSAWRDDWPGAAPDSALRGSS